MLEKYYRNFASSEKVVQYLDMYSIVQAFKLPSEVGDYLITDGSSKWNFPSNVVTLLLKDDIDHHTIFALSKRNNHYKPSSYYKYSVGHTVFMVSSSMAITQYNNLILF